MANRKWLVTRLLSLGEILPQSSASPKQSKNPAGFDMSSKKILRWWSRPASRLSKKFSIDIHLQMVRIAKTIQPVREGEQHPCRPAFEKTDYGA